MAGPTVIGRGRIKSHMRSFDRRPVGPAIRAKADPEARAACSTGNHPKARLSWMTFAI